MPAFDEWPGIPRCIDADPEMFFAEKGGDTTPAIALCRICPVADPCLAYALQLPGSDDAGVWGGTTTRDRIQLRRRMGRQGRRTRWAA